MQTAEQIRSLYEVTGQGGDLAARGRFAVASCDMRDGKNGRFATMELRDPTGSITARCFESERVDELRNIGAIDCELRISTFNNQMSAVVQSFTRAELSRDEVMRFAGLDVDAHRERVAALQGLLGQCDGTIYGDILRELLAGEVWDELCWAPAAVKMHHAEPGGLVRHLYEVAQAGLGLLESTGQPYDRAYFIAGVFLHDIGKLDTYSMPPTIQYTAHGQMAEHQIWSTFRLAKACAKVGAPRAIEAKLVHIIEQAHGAFRHAQWQDPLGVEVKALASADLFSSRLGSTDRERRAAEALDQLFAEESEQMVESAARADLGARPDAGEMPLFS